MHSICLRNILSVFAILFIVSNLFAQQKMDDKYGQKIREFTTAPEYLNPIIDHLPESKTVPSPLKHFGTIIGDTGVLHYTTDIYGYFMALEKATPRIKVRTIGKTEEGREMIEVIVADEQTIRQLDTYRGYLNKLADPRTLKSGEAEQIIKKAKPIYYFTGGLHSTETGSPEMVMELAYRLAVEESPMIQHIRSNVITIICPVAEPDGRDRVVDVYRWRDANGKVTPRITYWGHYVAHDNNRDGYGLALNLTRNILSTYLYWKPTVLHDLHESVPYMYVSTGMGPYNPYFDASVVDEWNKLAYNDVNALTRRGMPGVWTWGYYNGWAGSYLFSIGNNRNGIGRFYETFGNSTPQTVERVLGNRSTSREWYRMNPPKEKTMWSLRNNTNYMQTGVLSALNFLATEKEDFLDNFYRRAASSVEKGANEAPYAFVIPKNQRRNLATERLVNLLLDNGIEVNETNEEVTWEATGKKDGKQSTANGAYIVRMDQPYRTMIGTLLDVQKFPANYDPPYDDVGWTMPYLYQVETYKVDDKNMLNKPMSLLKGHVQHKGSLAGETNEFYLINNTTDDEVPRFRFQLKDIPMQVAEQSFRADGQEYASGTLIIDNKNLSPDSRNRIEQKVKELDLMVTGTRNISGIKTHDLDVPKIALVHSWMTTPQNEGWWRITFDKFEIPYTYISFQDFRNLSPTDYDVIIIPDTRDNAVSLLQGDQAGPAIPWKKTTLTPHIGIIDETDNQGLGMGYEGAANLKKFVENGGLIITDANSASLMIDLGITRHVRITQTRNLETHGSIFNAMVVDSTSPIVYGYPDSLAVYFNQRPVLSADQSTDGFSGADFRTPQWIKDQRWNEEYPRVIMSFNKNQEKLFLSGMMKGGNELAGTPVVVDVPVKKGHVVMFANHPFWRYQTHGSHTLVFNTILNWNDLRTGWKLRGEEVKR